MPQVETESRYCVICSKLITRGVDSPYDYKQRQTCRTSEQQDLAPSERCSSKFRSQRSKGVSRPHYLSKGLEKTPPTARKGLSRAEAEQLDYEQRQIEIALNERYYSQITCSEVRILPPEEVAELQGVYTPPKRSRADILPHFHHLRFTV